MKKWLRKKILLVMILLFAGSMFPLLAWDDSDDNDSSWDWSDDDGDDDCFDWGDIFDDNDDDSGDDSGNDSDDYWSGDDLDNADNYHNDDPSDDGDYSDWDGWFDDKKDDDSSDSWESIVSHYEEAKSAVEAVLEGEKQADPIEFAQMQEAYDEAKDALDSYCNSHGMTYTTDVYSGAITVYDADKNVVDVVGDPVILSSGLFRLDDLDIRISVGKTEWLLLRRYTSPRTEDECDIGGAFGSAWTSPLDSRIILGYCSVSPSEVDKWQGLVDSAQNALETIASYADEDPECNEFLSKIQAVLDERIYRRDELSRRIQKAAVRKEKNKYTEYGFAGRMAQNLGVNRLIFVDDRGNPIVFEEGDGGYTGGRYGAGMTVSYDEQGDCYTVTYTSGEKRIYDGTGLLKLIEFQNGGTIAFNYDESHRPSRITVNGAQSLTCQWASGLLASVSDGTETVRYAYQDGLLVSVTDGSDDIKTYSYDEKRRLVRQGKPDGSFIGFGYETGEDGIVRTAFTVNENGARETFSYELKNRRTTYKDHDGVESIFEYDEENRTTKEIYADGRVVSYGYGQDGTLAWRESNGKRETYGYDDRNHLISVEFSDGSKLTQRYAGNNLISYTDRDGITTQFDYDLRGNNTAVYRGGQKVWGYVYNTLNLVTEASDCHGNRLVFAYDAKGNLLSKKIFASSSSNAALTETWQYDAKGRVTKHTLPSGITQTYRYEKHAVFCSSSNGFESEMRYSNRKDVVYFRQKDTVTGEVRIYQYEYDSCHNCVRVLLSGTDGNGLVYKPAVLESSFYTGEGKLSGRIVWDSGERGWAVRNEYGTSGTLLRRKTGLVDKNGFFSGDTKEIVCAYQQEADGVVIAETAPDGKTQTCFYDAENRLVEIRNGSAVREKNLYSAGGRLVQALTPVGGEVAYTYDGATGFFAGSKEISGTLGMQTVSCAADGRKTMIVNPLGEKVFYYYDVFGNVSRIVQAGKTEEWQYDNANRLVRHTVSAPDGTAVRTESFSYSKDGRSVTHVEGDLYSTVYRKNAFGEIISIKDAAGNTERFVYDVRGRCIEKYDAYDRKTQLFYNGRNQITKIVARNGTATTYTYDADGNCVKEQDERGIVFSASYDAHGRLIEKKQFPSPVTETYEYDDKDRITKIQRGNIPVARTKFYDDEKRFVRTDAKGKSSEFRTDGFGRIQTEKNRLGDIQQFSFREDGSLAYGIDFAGNRRTYHFNRDENKVMVAYPEESRSEEVRDAAGNIVLASTQDSRLYFTYDKAGHMLSQQDVATGETTRFTYDECARRSRLLNEKQDIRYQYGKCGELTKITDKVSGISLRFVYDSMGNEVLRVHSTGESVLSVYDKASRLILTASFGKNANLVALEGYVYGKNGERTLALNSDFTVTRYKYDENGRLCAVQYPYTNELAAHLKNMCDEAGAEKGGENNSMFPRLSLLSSEYDALRALCVTVGALLLQPQINRTMLEERFFYDENGNLSRRETPYGTIHYSYDAEDRLIGWGKEGLARYDANGNMIYRKKLSEEVECSYNMQNRMERVSVKDLRSGEIASTVCRYDAFGRRTQTISLGTGSFRTVYDGLSFRDLYVVRGDDVDLTADDDAEMRYAYIDDSYADGHAETVFPRTGSSSALAQKETKLTDGGYTVLYGNSRTPVVLNPLGSGSAEHISLFSDSIGTVKAMSKSNGTSMHFAYDVFGAALSPKKTTAAAQPYGFAGKKSLETTSLYDFGYRDYSPFASRFTTPDPARDGSNWYTYCGGDPVNWVDPDGWQMELVVDKGSHAPNTAVYSENRPTFTSIEEEIKWNEEHTETRDTCIMDVYQDGTLIMQIEVTVAVVSHNSSFASDENRTQVTGNSLTHPTQFPDGTYTITAVTPNNTGKDTFESAWLRTDATQLLEDLKTGERVVDGGYCIHYTALSMTDGCVGVQSKEAMDSLVWAVIQNEKNDPHSTTITVLNSSMNSEPNNFAKNY